MKPKAIFKRAKEKRVDRHMNLGHEFVVIDITDALKDLCTKLKETKFS